MGIQISDNIIVERDVDDTWYLRDIVTNLISKECFISVEIAQKCVRRGYEVTWVEEERGKLQGDSEVLSIA